MKKLLFSLLILISFAAQSQRLQDLQLYTGANDSSRIPVNILVGSTWTTRQAYGRDLFKNVYDSLRSAIQAKVGGDLLINGHPVTSNITLTAADFGLSEVNNTSDANKPVSTAQQDELDKKPNQITVAGLRALSSPSITIPYQITDISKAGVFRYDASDLSSADDGAMVIVNGTKRFKRVFDGAVHAKWFGVVAVDLISTAQSSPVQTANTTALQNAINYLIQTGGNTLIIPDGFIHVNDLLEVSTRMAAPGGGSYSFVPRRIEIKGLGKATLIQNHATAPLLRFYGSTFRPAVKDLRLWGRGSATAGDLLEIVSAQYWNLDNVEFRGTGGRGLHLMGSSERGTAKNLLFIWCRQAATTASAAINECYFWDTHALGCGYTVDPIDESSNKASYSVNVAGDGYSIKTSGNYYAEKHTAFYFKNAANIRFIGGSIKTTDHIGGIKIVSAENFQIDNVYFEGFVLGANPSVIAYGNSEKTTTTQAITASDLTFTVADTKWFANTTSDIAFDADYESRYFVIYDPADVATYEVVTLRNFYNGTARLIARGQASTTARIWGSGVVIREYFSNAGNGNNAAVTLNNCHLSSNQALPGTATIVQDNFEAVAGEVINGIIYDEFHSSSAKVQGSSTITSQNNRFATYPAPNGGKVQMHQGANWWDVKGETFASVIGTQDVAANAQYAAWSYLSPNETYIPNSTNNLPVGLKIGKGANEGVALGGYGWTNGIVGQRGVFLSKENLKDSIIASFDDKGAYNGFKIWKKAAGVWTNDYALTDNYIKVGGARMSFGAGSPESVVAAPIGSVYLQTDGSAGTTLWVKEAGTGTVGWKAQVDKEQGVSGGHNIFFGVGASEGGYISSNPSGTKGKYYFNAAQTLTVDELNSRIGLGTASPTRTFTLSNSTTGIDYFNTADQTTNVEAFTVDWSSNTLRMLTRIGGTGTNRGILLGITNGPNFNIYQTPASSGIGFFDFRRNISTALSTVISIGSTFTQSAIGAGNPNLFSLIPTINQSGTAGYNVFTIAPFEQAVGSGLKYLLRLGLSSAADNGGTLTDKFAVYNTGKTAIGSVAAAASAIVEVNSTTQGVLLPRMTTTQRDAISSPATALELFCTDCTAVDGSTGVKQVYNGSTWKNCW
jgi:hypothetical protein